MEDKQKQIEEMFNDIVEIADRPYYYDNKGHAHIDFVDLDMLAEKLVEKYQPKLPKDSVVLSKEEYKTWFKKDGYFLGYKDGEDSAVNYYENLVIPSKEQETADKYFTKIIEMLKEVRQYGLVPPGELVFMHEKNKEIAKELGVDIGE